MSAQPDQENRAGLARITCGWKKPHLPMDVVRRYWRDVHSPGISRRPGLWEYRHMQFDAVRADLFAPVAGVTFACEPEQQLQWTSDVRYLDQAALDLFGAHPRAEVKALLLGDIDLIVDQSTTYLVVGDNARTLLDRTGSAAPQGPAPAPSFSVFFRQRGEQAASRAGLRALAQRWADAPGVLRVRLSLFDVPDMEAERRAGYPIKTHPVERQYQALIDLTLADESTARGLLHAADAEAVHTVHAYPAPVTYTSVCQGRPTLVGLRGYAAHDAIEAMQAHNQKQLPLLEWMYGSVVQGGPLA